MKRYRRVLATLFLLLLLGCVLASTAGRCYFLERTACLERLAGYAEQVASELQRAFQADRAYLEQLSTLFSQYDLEALEEVQPMLSALSGTGMISRLELLLPDDSLLTADGLADVSGKYAFQTDAEAGAHLARRIADPLDPDRFILRHCVPIKQDGETVAVLCGVTLLEEFPQRFPVEEYGDDLQLYIIEGATGNFLQDTWHGELGDLDTLGAHETKRGYSWGQVRADIAHGTAGMVVFRSNTANAYVYTYYTPAGVEDWMVSLSLPERVAFAQSENILHSLYGLTVLLLVIFLIYFLWILRDMRQERSANERRFRHVRYMLDVEKELFDAHMQPEHFVTALQKVADFLTAETAFFWLVERLPDMQRRLWSNQDNRELEQDEELVEMLSSMFLCLQAEGGIVSDSMESLCKKFTMEGKHLSRFRIHSLMLFPVSGLSGELAIVLGACNMGCRWEGTEPLEQVALSFSMAINHYRAHWTLARMGQVDSLTGLLNRNSYHTALGELSKGEYLSFACIYIDANGLHDLNNHLGHQAGDEMLKAVADELRLAFPQGGIYRIGGDEFVVFSQNQMEQDLYQQAEQLRQALEEQHYELSIGIEWRDQNFNIEAMVQAAEAAMQQNKQQYYSQGGKERRARFLNRKMDQLILEKQDADAFLAILAPKFKGVYFVDLTSDTIRHLFIPSYFEKMLKETGDQFSAALMLYANRIVKPEFLPLFEQLCDYNQLEKQLGSRVTPEFTYQKTDGSWMNLQVLKFKSYTQECQETLWIFKDMD